MGAELQGPEVPPGGDRPLAGRSQEGKTHENKPNISRFIFLLFEAPWGGLLYPWGLRGQSPPSQAPGGRCERGAKDLSCCCL